MNFFYNPYRQFDQRITDLEKECDQTDHRQQSVEDCLITQAKRIGVLEKETASAETVRWCVAEITRLEERLNALTKRTAAPLGMDGLTNAERVIREALLTARSPMTCPEVTAITGIPYKSVSAHLSRMARAGVIDRVKRGSYALQGYGDHPSRIIARSVGQVVGRG